MPAKSTQAFGQPFEDTVGGHLVNVVDWNGPAAAVGGTGETIDPAPFFGSYGSHKIQFAMGSISVSGTYLAICQPAAAGDTTWEIQYYTAATGAQIGAGPTDLSAEVFKIFAYGI